MEAGGRHSKMVCVVSLLRVAQKVTLSRRAPAAVGHPELRLAGCRQSQLVALGVESWLFLRGFSTVALSIYLSVNNPPRT